jgi:hypothetical protein
VEQTSYGIFASLVLMLTAPSAVVDEHDPMVTASHRIAVAGAAATHHPRVSGHDNLPISFEPNVGQAAPQIEYLARGRGYGVTIARRGPLLTLREDLALRVRRPLTNGSLSRPLSPEVLRLRPAHAQFNAAPRGERRMNGVSNYFIGNDSSKWHSNVANYAAVRYAQVYPGIDWVIYGGNLDRLEYDFVVAPHADPRLIELDVAGAGSMSVDGNGDLLIETHGRVLRQLKPVIYQIAADGAKHEIDGRYVLAHRRYAFALGGYDHSRQLVIDPAFVFSTYLGGSVQDAAAAIAVDGEGNAYVAGFTSSADFPTASPFQATNHSVARVTYPTNAFVTKFNAAGSALVYSTYLGGSGLDAAKGIAVDSAGNAYVTGSTTSADFPTAAPFQATNRATAPASFPSNAFVTKLDSTGTALVYSTYLGGSGPTGGESTSDGAAAIAVDSAGNAYVAGQTASSDFPTLNPFQATNHTGGSAIGSNAFVTKLNASGSALVYSTYLGGSFSDGASAIAVDSAGSVYVAGSAASTDFPTAVPLQATNKAAGEGLPPQGLGHFPTTFLTKFNATGSALVYSTYLGGSCQEWAAGVAVDGDGNAFVAGATCSSDFPTVNPLQGSNHALVPGTNPFNAFVSKVNSGGSGLVYSTYLGGSLDDRATTIALDSAGNAYVGGFALSQDFPLELPLQSRNNGAANASGDAFVSILNAAGSALMFSTYLGGSGSAAAARKGDLDSAAAVAVDHMGDLYVTGATYSTDFPTAAPFQAANNASSGGTAFVTKIAMQSDPSDPPPPRSGGGGAMGWGLIGILGFGAAIRWRKRASQRPK